PRGTAAGGAHRWSRPRCPGRSPSLRDRCRRRSAPRPRGPGAARRRSLRRHGPSAPGCPADPAGPGPPPPSGAGRARPARPRRSRRRARRRRPGRRRLVPWWAGGRSPVLLRSWLVRSLLARSRRTLLRLTRSRTARVRPALGGGAARVRPAVVRNLTRVRPAVGGLVVQPRALGARTRGLVIRADDRLLLRTVRARRRFPARRHRAGGRVVAGRCRLVLRRHRTLPLGALHRGLHRWEVADRTVLAGQ